MKTTHISPSSPPLNSEVLAKPKVNLSEGGRDSAYRLPFDNLRSSLEMSLSRFISQGQNADSRISMILSANITMMGALVAVLSNSKLLSLGPGAWVASGLAFLLGICSIACVAYGSLPRGGIGKSNSLPQDHNFQGTVLFFSSVANMSEKEYRRIFQTMEADAFLDDLTRQCHAVAQIVDLKFRALRFSFICLILSILPWMLAISSGIHYQ